MRLSDTLPNFYKRKDDFDGKCNTSLNGEILCNWHDLAIKDWPYEKGGDSSKILVSNDLQIP